MAEGTCVEEEHIPVLVELSPGVSGIYCAACGAELEWDDKKDSWESLIGSQVLLPE